MNLKKINADVVGVSVDSHFRHLAWCNLDRKNGGIGCLTYPLLDDLTRSVSKDYGVLLDDAGIALRGTSLLIQMASFDNKR